MQDIHTKNSYGLPNTGFIRERKLVSLLPFSRGTLLSMTAAGDFPPKYQLSKGVMAWSCLEVIEWLDSKTKAASEVTNEPIKR